MGLFPLSCRDTVLPLLGSEVKSNLSAKMKIYKCIITGDEMFTDIYPIRDLGDLLYEVEAKHIAKKKDAIDDSLIGGNASAEEAPQEMEDAGSESGLNVALNHSYTETGFGAKKDFIKGMGAYLKAIIAKKTEQDPEFDAEGFKASHQAAMKEHLLPKFAELQFYMGESTRPDGTLAMLEWKKVDDGELPCYYFFKSGIEI